MNARLREIVLDTGSTDPCDWNADDRRAAALELYQADEKPKAGFWMGDALAELACNLKERQAILEALKHDSATMRHAALGVIVERALLSFPLDTLQRTAEENEGAWLAEERQCAAEREFDSRTEDRLLRNHA